jgi:hypothetical protein
VLQFKNEGGVIDKKLLQISLFRRKLVVNSSFGTSTCLLRALIRLGSRHTCAPNSFLNSPTTTCFWTKHRYYVPGTSFTHAKRQNDMFRKLPLLFSLSSITERVAVQSPKAYRALRSWQCPAAFNNGEPPPMLIHTQQYTRPGV